MRQLIVASLVAISFSALAVAQEPVTIRRDDGRWGTADRAWALEDVPASSPLYGIRVTDSPDHRSVIVEAGTDRRSPLLLGDRLDEVQLPGILDRERQANPGYWPYQVWNASDFYRLAAQCLAGCLVRLRGAESTTYGGSQAMSGPRVFAYLPIGPGGEFAATQDRDGSVAAYVDVRTGEQFGPAASAVFRRR